MYPTRPPAGAELDPLLLEDTLSLELVSENQEETETEGSQGKEQTDSEKSPSESGASASSFEDLDGNVAADKAQQGAKTEWSQMPESWDKERAEEWLIDSKWILIVVSMIIAVSKPLI